MKNKTLIFFITLIYIFIVFYTISILFKIDKSTHPEINKLILSWDPGYRFISQFSDCRELGCQFTYDKTAISKAGLVLFSVAWAQALNYSGQMPKREFPEQIFMGFCNEPTTYYNLTLNQTFIQEHLNATAGFRYITNEPSHVYMPYGPESVKNMLGYVFKYGPLITKIPENNRENKILFAASNCKSFTGRDQIVTELMKYIDIDSIGKCVHNKNITVNRAGMTTQQNGDVKLQILKTYKFALAIENSECDDYVTEKLWEPLSVGTIPIYLGAKNVKRFLPHPDAIIHIRDFDSAQSLSDYIKLVDTNETLRRKHLQWIEEPRTKEYQQLYKDSKDYSDMFCGMCRRLIDYQTTNMPRVLRPIDIPFPECELKPYTFPINSSAV
ncbi:glycosyltransferase [Tieghemostelium lacteum]|uniref:Fucosyltransferase n=1 Tax=Tieghemostelium lacteum TaxID=361077 RepID=A0A152A3K8_TIELA|nr:glycosyltransferase [Tieghemostelium lacteum]|eukprot:KYR00806.1 glycosyltransferase [Tieghemostelium lacteum]